MLYMEYHSQPPPPHLHNSTVAQDFVPTKATLQRCPAVKELTTRLQLHEPRHPKRPQLALVKAGSVTKKLATYNDALINDERYLD